jgi:hypothetical protein
MNAKTTGIMTAEEWLDRNFELSETDIIIGSTNQAIIRPLTKNIIEGSWKSFKTTFALRLMLGLSCGETVFEKLPVLRCRKALYVHGELSPPEIRERTQSAVVGLPRPLDNFLEVRDLRIHLIQPQGQSQLREILDKARPDDLVLDPWQSFIIGSDENEFRDMSQATRFIDNLIADYSLSVHICTHTGKDPTRGTRGHSVIAGWRDTLIKLERKGSELVTVTIEPRWAARVEPFNLKFTYGTLLDTDAELFTKQARDIRRVITTNGGRASKEQVGTALSLDGDALRKALSRAAMRRAIVVNGDDVTLEVGGRGTE